MHTTPVKELCAPRTPFLRKRRGMGKDEAETRRQQGQRLRQAREAAGFSNAKEAATRLRLPSSTTYQHHENGTRGLARSAELYSEAFGVPAEWLLYGRNPPEWADGASAPARRKGRTVPLVGYVGAGAQAHYYASADEGLGEVDAPEDATETTVAAEIRGVSLGPALDRWLVFYDEVRSPVTPDMHGRLCVVGLDDERVLVKVIRPAGEPGRFHLISNGSEEPIFDQAVMWAAKVTGMKPR